MESASTFELIAEIGSVHDGSLGNAGKLIDAAAAAGASAVKFQTHIADAETLPDAPSPGFFTAEPRMSYFRRTAFTPDQWGELKARAEDRGLVFLSSAFSLEAIELLEDIGVCAHKIPSGEVTNLPLLERVAATGKRVYLSSGMSSWAELDAAVEALSAGGRITVMQCSSRYPCEPESVGLNVIGEMRERYGLEVGFSDHTLGRSAAIAAVSLGASVIEKHLTFSRQMYGSDAAHSMEPDEFRQLAADLDELRRMLENPVAKDDLRPYVEMKQVFEKSVVTARDLPRGTVLEYTDLAFKKPGGGVPPRDYRRLLGATTTRTLPRNHPIALSDLVPTLPVDARQ